MKINIVIVQEGAEIPQYATEGSVGFEMQIRPKSGNSLKTNLQAILGTIDSDYRGEIGIIVQNISKYTTKVECNHSANHILYHEFSHLTFVLKKT
jgi:dUTP pyrophosphatase